FAANARRCAGSFAALPGALPSIAHVCSELLAHEEVRTEDVREEARLADAQRVDVTVVALVRLSRTKRKPTKRRSVYIVGFSSHTLFSSQAISSSRSATTS